MRPELPGRMASGTCVRGKPSPGSRRSRVQDPVSKEAVEGPRGERASQGPCQMGECRPLTCVGQQLGHRSRLRKRRKRGARS